MKSVIVSSTLQALVSRARIARVLVAVAFAGVFAAGCKGTSEPGVTASLTISPTTVTLAPGGTQQFTVVAKNASGDVLAIPNPTWSVTAGGGTITSTGLYTAGTTAGTFTVSVTCNSVTATASVIVTPGALLTITVTPNPDTLVIGGTQQFTAVGKDANGNVVAITPVWSTVNPPGSINATGFFTAGNTTGTFPNTVKATQGAISGTATVVVIAGPLFTITVTPNPDTLVVGAQQQFTAVGKDAGGNVVPIPPPLVWSVVDPLAGTINSGSGLFTAGTTPNTYPNTVKATSGAISGTATVVVISPPPPPPVSGFTVLANAAVTCTSGSITGDVGTFQAAPTGSITQSTCPITGGTAQVGTAASIAAYNNFLTAYAARAPKSGDCDVTHTLTGTLAGVTLPPGVYCFTAAASPTGVLTLNGPSTGVWLFKIGTSGTGALTGSSFTVTMAGGALACNVTWWVAQAASMTDSFFNGTILAGAGITLTRTSFNGNTWAGASGSGDVTFTGPGNPVTGCP
jgi:hypothetical protein